MNVYTEGEIFTAPDGRLAILLEHRSHIDPSTQMRIRTLHCCYCHPNGKPVLRLRRDLGDGHSAEYLSLPYL